jgi:hypothetical protein
MPRSRRIAASFLSVFLLSSCADAASSDRSEIAPEASPDSAARVPLLNDALYAEACALPRLPVQTQAQRSEMKRLSLDLLSRHERVKFPRSQSEVWFRVFQLHTLAELPPGSTFFESPLPVTLPGNNGIVTATTLEEGLRQLSAACSDDG